MDLMSRFFASDYIAWGCSDLGFSSEPIFGRLEQINYQLILLAER